MRTQIKKKIKPKVSRKVDIIVNPNKCQLIDYSYNVRYAKFNCIKFPENRCMPLAAVKKVKKELDKNKNDVVLFTCNSDVARFAYYYNLVIDYNVRLFYGTKRMSLPKVFKKFNKVLDFHEDVIVDKILKI